MAAVLSAVLWQRWDASKARWRDLDPAANAMLEAGLASSQAIVNITPGILLKLSSDFDVDNMTVDDMHVRRRDNSPVTTTTEYWDDEAWTPLDSFAQSTVHAALAAGRDKIVISVHPALYELTLTRPVGMQVNKHTGRARPLLIQGVPPVVGNDDDDDDEPDKELVDDPSMPTGYRCPITHMPMNCPVMATDGHSYEASAIQKWLKSKNTSPMTGARLPNTTLIKNHFLADSIRTWSDAANAAGMEAPKKKRMRTMRSD